MAVPRRPVASRVPVPDMTPHGRSPHALALLVVAVVLVGLTLRGPIVGVPPLLTTIQEDLLLAPATAGLVTSLPLIAFAVLSPFVSGLVRRLGVDHTLLLSLLLLGAAIGLRPWTGAIGLLLGTAVVGIAITIGNVTLPVLVRRDAGHHVPQVMAVSVGAYGIGQTLAVYLAVPVASVAGWRWSIMLPGVFVALALAVWVVRMRATEPLRRQTDVERTAPKGPGWSHVWRQGSAWWLAAFFGLQSIIFYTASTWLPAQLVATAAMSEQTAGTALSVFHLVGIAGTFLVPPMLRWAGSARRVGVGVALGWLVFFVGLYVAPAGWVGWMALGGLVHGAGIGLALTLVATRPRDVDYGRYVSGMVQGVGYGLAAIGPVLVGWLADLTSGWTVPTVLMAASALVMVFVARQAGSPRPIGP